LVGLTFTRGNTDPNVSAFSLMLTSEIPLESAQAVLLSTPSASRLVAMSERPGRCRNMYRAEIFDFDS